VMRLGSNHLSMIEQLQLVKPIVDSLNQGDRIGIFLANWATFIS
jgi:hypothetical protein